MSILSCIDRQHDSVICRLRIMAVPGLFSQTARLLYAMRMTHKITLHNSGEYFNVDPGESILAAAQRQNITLPYGCDNGVCGACIYRIIEGSVDYPDGQPFALFEEDMQAGKGLCCVGHPTSDMIIELEYPDVDFEPWI